MHKTTAGMKQTSQATTRKLQCLEPKSAAFICLETKKELNSKRSGETKYGDVTTEQALS